MCVRALRKLAHFGKKIRKRIKAGAGHYIQSPIMGYIKLYEISFENVFLLVYINNKFLT